MDPSGQHSEEVVGILHAQGLLHHSDIIPAPHWVTGTGIPPGPELLPGVLAIASTPRVQPRPIGAVLAAATAAASVTLIGADPCDVVPRAGAGAAGAVLGTDTGTAGVAPICCRRLPRCSQ